MAVLLFFIWGANGAGIFVWGAKGGLSAEGAKLQLPKATIKLLTTRGSEGAS